MNQALTYADVRLNYALSAPQQRFRDAGLFNATVRIMSRPDRHL